jgi:hypothetical protein
MKKKRVFILVLMITLIASTLILYNYLAALPPAYRVYKKPDIQISSEELISSFNKNESKANTLFVGKVIETKGVIKKITYQNDEFTILLKGENEFSYVICVMQSDQYVKVNQMILGQSIVLKGMCKGFLNDVIFFNCIILKS